VTSPEKKHLVKRLPKLTNVDEINPEYIKISENITKNKEMKTFFVPLITPPIRRAKTQEFMGHTKLTSSLSEAVSNIHKFNKNKNMSALGNVITPKTEKIGKIIHNTVQTHIDTQVDKISILALEVHPNVSLAKLENHIDSFNQTQHYLLEGTKIELIKPYPKKNDNNMVIHHAKAVEDTMLKVKNKK
jgi:hypothetical protein